MTTLHHLLAATDLSAPARHAVERAALISKETGAPLDVLHVANLAPLERLRLLMMASPEALQQRVLDSARERLHELVAALQERYGISAGARVVAGSLLDELSKEADAMRSSLIVCGARGESFVRHLLLGSTAERMLSGTKCPMLVVKQVAHEPYRSLLVPVDFSPSSLLAIRCARRVAPKAEIVLLHTFELPFEGHLRYASVDNDTINRYRIRWQHFARVMLLAGTSLLLWRAVLVLLLYVQYAINAPVWRWSGITVAWSAYSDWRELLIDPVSMGVFVLAVATGLSRYLQVRRGWAMGILSVFIVLLALVAPVPAMTVLFGRTDNHYVGALNDLWPGMVQIIGRVLAY